jgi:hypothetical protein
MYLGDFIMKKNLNTTIQSDSKKADEIEIPEVEIVPSEEIENDEILNTDAEVEQDDEETTPEHITEEASEPEPEIKPISENTPKTEVPNNLKIKALKRALENKTFSLDRENSKCNGWVIQAKDRDDKTSAEYHKRKSELEDLMKKNDERYDKRMAKTKKWWWDFTLNYQQTKLKKIEDDIALLQSELLKFESLEIKPEETN